MDKNELQKVKDALKSKSKKDIIEEYGKVYSLLDNTLKNAVKICKLQKQNRIYLTFIILLSALAISLATLIEIIINL